MALSKVVRFSLREAAKRTDAEPSQLSNGERGDVKPPAEAMIAGPAVALGGDAGALLAPTVGDFPTAAAASGRRRG